MAITIHQRVHLWLWHWRDGPGWVRSNSDELRALRADGARVIRVQLQDDGDVPDTLVALYHSMGFKVWGAIRPSGAPLEAPGTVWYPEQTALFGKSERVRLGLNGIDWNFEREVRDQDTATNGWWSSTFKTRARQLMPTLPMVLDTVYGDFAGGINNVYTPDFRMNVQTYWGPEGTWDDPPTNIVKWCSTAQPPIAKANVKPVIRVSPNSAGELVGRDTVIQDCKAAGTKGIVFYYIDGAPLDHLRAFIRESIAAGIAY